MWSVRLVAYTAQEDVAHVGSSVTNVIYVTRNGLLEPLGQSQVLAYLRGLSTDYKITLITQEKKEDWEDSERMGKASAECERLGINWIPKPFWATPSSIAPFLDLMRMSWLLLLEVRRQRAILIHARSYLPASAASIVGWITGVPFIFDMRALWPEELITAGRLKRGSLPHKILTLAERVCLRRAGAVVSLTHAAVEHLEAAYPAFFPDQTVEVIPTCADLDRFRPAKTAPKSRTIGCLGTVLSGWFRLDMLSAFLNHAALQDPDLLVQLTTKDNQGDVRTAVDAKKLLGPRLKIEAAAPEDVPEILQNQMASVMFFSAGLGKLGSSPTRMAEVLGCGLPVVTNAGVGDVARIIQDHKVGVIVRGTAPEDMDMAFQELQLLLGDPTLAKRCRTTAEELFSLEAGTKAFGSLYAKLTSEKRACAA